MAEIRHYPGATPCPHHGVPMHTQICRPACCTEAGDAELVDLRAKCERLEDFLGRRGFRRCDIPACNCNFFHGGHADTRLREIYDALGTLTQGKTALMAVTELVNALDAERVSGRVARESLWVALREAEDSKRLAQDAVAMMKRHRELWAHSERALRAAIGDAVRRLRREADDLERAAGE